MADSHGTADISPPPAATTDGGAGGQPARVLQGGGSDHRRLKLSEGVRTLAVQLLTSLQEQQGQLSEILLKSGKSEDGTPVIKEILDMTNHSKSSEQVRDGSANKRLKTVEVESSLSNVLHQEQSMDQSVNIPEEIWLNMMKMIDKKSLINLWRMNQWLWGMRHSFAKLELNRLLWKEAKEKLLCCNKKEIIANCNCINTYIEMSPWETNGITSLLTLSTCHQDGTERVYVESFTEEKKQLAVGISRKYVFIQKQGTNSFVNSKSLGRFLAIDRLNMNTKTLIETKVQTDKYDMEFAVKGSTLAVGQLRKCTSAENCNFNIPPPNIPFPNIPFFFPNSDHYHMLMGISLYNCEDLSHLGDITTVNKTLESISASPDEFMSLDFKFKQGSSQLELSPSGNYLGLFLSDQVADQFLGIHNVPDGVYEIFARKKNVFLLYNTASQKFLGFLKVPLGLYGVFLYMTDNTAFIFFNLREKNEEQLSIVLVDLSSVYWPVENQDSQKDLQLQATRFQTPSFGRISSLQAVHLLNDHTLIFALDDLRLAKLKFWYDDDETVQATQVEIVSLGQQEEGVPRPLAAYPMSAYAMNPMTTDYPIAKAKLVFTFIGSTVFVSQTAGEKHDRLLFGTVNLDDNFADISLTKLCNYTPVSPVGRFEMVYADCLGPVVVMKTLSGHWKAKSFKFCKSKLQSLVGWCKCRHKYT